MGKTRNVQKRESVDIKRSGNMEERWKSYNNNFKSCFPHVEPLIFKGSKIFITTVLPPVFWLPQIALRKWSSGGHFYVFGYMAVFCQRMAFERHDKTFRISPEGFGKAISFYMFMPSMFCSSCSFWMVEYGLLIKR